MNRKRKTLKNLVIFAIICVLINSNIFAGNDNGKLKTLIIDPGHGGEDPGALGSRAKEKDIVLGIGLKLGKIINENLSDVKVIYTRSEDVFIPLHERAEIANRNNADLFISIHANANKNHAVYGVETYAMGLHTSEKNLEVAKKENAAITFEKDYSQHYEGYDPNSAESFIIFNLMQNTYMDQSLDFAGIVEEKVDKTANRTGRGVKQAGFLVLWKTTMPSVLIETGFITNLQEEKYLCSEEGQSAIALSIFKAFSEYKNKIDSKSNFNTTHRDDEKTVIPLENNDSVQSNDSLIIFKIQILTSSKKLSDNDKVFENCKKIEGFKTINEFSTKNGHKYAIGESTSYDEMSNLNKEVKKYYPKAFVIAIRNGKIIQLNEAIRKN